MSNDYPEDDEVYTRDTAPRSDSTFDPRTLGCRCDECPLGAKHRADMTWAPVPPEHRTQEGACGKLTMVGDFPAADEVILRRPQVGVSGQLLVGALRASRVQRQEVSFSNMILCRPPASDLDRFRIELKRKWKRDVRVWKKGGSIGPEPLEPLDPVEACRPHLEAMILESDRVVSLGVNPSKWILNRNKGINSIRGGFYEVAVWREASGRFQRETLGSESQFFRQYKVIQVVPTISPAVALDPTWARVLHRDIQRAVRWATNRLDWKDPHLITSHPTVEEIQAFLNRPGPFECDIETTRHGPILSVNRCIGIYDSTTDQGITIPWESLDGLTGLYPGQPYTGFRARDNPGGSYERGHYTEQEGLEIIRLLKIWLLTAVAKIGHNFLLFDLAILERDLGLLDDPVYLTAEDPIYVVDSIFLARCEDSELPRTLYLQGTMACDVPDWKGGGEDDTEIRISPKTYPQLAFYNATDNRVTGIVARKLWDKVYKRGQLPIFEFDRRGARIAREMTHLGIRINQEKRWELEQRYTVRVAESREKIAGLVKRKNFNPGSTQQLSELLYEDWNLPIIRLTETGAPSTDDDTLRELMPLTEGYQRELLSQIRHDRLLNKTLSGAIVPLRMWNDERRNRDGEIIAEGLCGADGRVHPQYPTFVPATGRWASKNPNSQNYTVDLRVIFEPEEGHVYLMADYDQIELRLFSAMAKVQGYLDVFKANGDPHAMTAMLIYGKKFETEMLAAMTEKQRLDYERTGVPQKVSGSSTYELLRVFAKTFVYCIIYGGTDDTVYLSVSSATYPEGAKDEKGNDLSGKLIFPDMTRREVTVAFNAFLRNAKEIPAYWEKVEEFCKRNRFVVEPLLNRRRDFLEFDRNGALNHGIQCVVGSTRVTTDTGLRQISELVGQRFLAWTGKKWAPATAICKGSARIYEVAYLGMTIEVDSTHSFLRDDLEGYVWAHTNEVGMARVALDMARPLDHGQSTLTSEDGFWLGYYIANGSSTQSSGARKAQREGRSTTAERRASFTIGNDYRSGPADRNGSILHARLGDWVTGRGGTCWTEFLAKDQEKSDAAGSPRGSAVSPEEATHYKVGVSADIDRLLASWTDLAQDAHEKRVPEVIWQAPLEVRRQFLRGMLYGNGFVDPTGGVLLSLCNRKLVQDCTLLARSVGVMGHVLGPYVADRAGHLFWRGVWNGAQSAKELGFGHCVRVKSDPDALAPFHEVQRVWPRLKPTCASDHTLRSRMRHGDRSTTPYMFQRMGVDDVYDHTRITVTPTDREEPVYTLIVDDPEHRYVTQGLISKNSGAFQIAATGLLNLRRIFIPDFRRKLGIVNMMHDSFTIEVEEDRCEDLVKPMEKAINLKFAQIPGVDFSSEADIMINWRGKPKKGDLWVPPAKRVVTPTS